MSPEAIVMDYGINEKRLLNILYLIGSLAEEEVFIAESKFVLTNFKQEELLAMIGNMAGDTDRNGIFLHFVINAAFRSLYHTQIVTLT
jgi:hypothetical protein